MKAPHLAEPHTDAELELIDSLEVPMNKRKKLRWGYVNRQCRNPRCQQVTAVADGCPCPACGWRYREDDPTPPPRGPSTSGPAAVRGAYRKR